MSPVRNIAILGGGPAGATCGERLSRAGFQVTIYDEHLAWEKPCGGGLTQKALAAFPFLVSSPVPKKPINNVELISSDGKRARLRLDWPIIISAREVLSGFALEPATEAGCDVAPARVTRVEIDGPPARLEAAGGWHAADIVG